MKAKLTLMCGLTALALAPAGWSMDDVNNAEAAKQAANIKCLECHQQVTPNVVADWKISEHSREGITCAHCHGLEHNYQDDVSQVQFPQPSTCAKCHEKQVKQFRSGKHALSWAAMNAMPTTHNLPMALTKGNKGCGGCHKIGEKSPQELATLKKEGSGYGHAACDSCHTRHAFSKIEAQQPQACQTCHMGFDHPQWEMYSASKHGVRALRKWGVAQNGFWPHMSDLPHARWRSRSADPVGISGSALAITGR